MALSDGQLATLEDFALDLARVAGEAILPLFRGAHGLEDKGPAKNGGFDPVTEADRGAERAIRRAIAARHPDHGVIGEEEGEDRPDAPFVWVLDPIDGTRAFICGLPVWTTLIALRVEGRPEIGVIGQSFLDEAFIGSPRGARLVRHGVSRPIRTRPCPRLGDALAATTDPDLHQGPRRAAWERLRASVRLARYGCDAYAYACVAMGALDLVAESGLKAWDVEAAVPLIAAAGGRISHWSGEPVGRSGGDLLIAGDPAAHAAAVEVLAR